MNESDTPRTEINAAKRASGLRAIAIGLEKTPDKETAIKCLNHAADKIEDLERELAEYKKCFEESQQNLTIEVEEVERLKLKLTAITEQRDRLAECFAELYDIYHRLRHGRISRYK
jgi:predicted  nucleic acid-binding Zn-ribbon protein